MTDSSDAKSPPTLMLSETREAPDVVARLIAENEATCSELGKRLRDRPPLFAVTCARRAVSRPDSPSATRTTS